MKEWQKILPQHERLRQIVQISYELLCNKIVGGSITIQNEACLQMHLGVILKQVGQLYEFATHDRFSIDLETWKDIDPTTKSRHGRARCDIMITLESGDKRHEAAIELKYFKKSTQETITDNRFSLLMDLQNLEQYVANQPSLLCYEIVYTENPNYADPNNRSKIKITPIIPGETVVTYAGKEVCLNKTYKTNWESYPSDKSGHHFLKIDL